jgi:hypothetical protein
VVYCGAEISNSLKSNWAISSSPVGFATALLQKGCLAVRSPAKIELSLKLKSSVISISLQARPGDL